MKANKFSKSQSITKQTKTKPTSSDKQIASDQWSSFSETKKSYINILFQSKAKVYIDLPNTHQDNTESRQKNITQTQKKREIFATQAVEKACVVWTRLMESETKLRKVETNAKRKLKYIVTNYK